MAVQTRNTALGNEFVRLYCRFVQNGVLTDPASQPAIEILDVDGGTIIDGLPAQKEHTGVWYVDWFVPKDLPLGTYYDQWMFQWSSTGSVQTLVMPINVQSFDNYVNFISRGLSLDIGNRTYQLLTDLKNNFIYEACHIPVYFEQVMRVQDESIPKRKVKYYFVTLTGGESVSASKGAVYFNNGQKFTVMESLVPETYSSSSSSSTSSTSSIDSNSSSSSSSSSANESSSSSSSSESALITTTTTTEYQKSYILSLSGSGDPDVGSPLAKVSGEGDEFITISSFTSEQSRMSTRYNAAYRNWDRDWKPIVYLNNAIVESGWTTDYDGNIYFDRYMSPEDVVHVSYRWSCYSTEHLLSFLRLGLQMMNTVPPASDTYSSLETMPFAWNAPVLLYAAVQAMRRAIFALNFQEKKIVYGPLDSSAASEAAGRMQQLYQDYSSTWEEVKKDVKTRKLGVMAQISIPEYTLPGGRSRWLRYMFQTSG